MSRKAEILALLLRCCKNGRLLRQTALLFMSDGTQALQACDLPLTNLKSRLIMGISKPHSVDGKPETDGDVCMKVGYIRVSKQEQHEALQLDALRKAGCEKWFLDKITGTKAERKGLNEALAYLRPEDTLVVWKLDLAGRSLKHLMELLNIRIYRDISFISLTEQIATTTT